MIGRALMLANRRSRKIGQWGLPSASMWRIGYDLAKAVRFGATESVESLLSGIRYPERR
jgi:hypothetical protein